METKQLVEGNKMIAEFMGAVIKPEVISEWLTQKEVWIFPDGKTVYGGVSYHTSWDWLMPCVKKINDLCIERGRPLSDRSREQEHLENPLDNPLHWKSWSYHYIQLSTDINQVWKKTVAFIQWYNQQNELNE